MNESNQLGDWRSLCELASKERDSQKLMDLVAKIKRALEKCHQLKERQDTAFRTDTELPMTVGIASRRDFDSFPVQPSHLVEYDC